MYKEPGAYTNIDKKDLEEEVRYVVAIDNTAPTSSKNKVWSINKINAEFANQNEVQKVSSDLENVKIKADSKINILEYEKYVQGDDWTIAFQKAIDYAEENYTTIKIPCRDLPYKIGELFIKQYVSFEGDNNFWGENIHHSLPKNDSIIITTATNVFSPKTGFEDSIKKVAITKLSFDCKDGIRGTFFNNLKLEGSYIYNNRFRNYNILFKSSIEGVSTIERNLFLNIQKNFFYCPSKVSMTDSRIVNNYINGSTSKNDVVAFDVLTPNQSVIRDNFIDYFNIAFKINSSIGLVIDSNDIQLCGKCFDIENGNGLIIVNNKFNWISNKYKHFWEEINIDNFGVNGEWTILNCSVITSLNFINNYIAESDLIICFNSLSVSNLNSYNNLIGQYKKIYTSTVSIENNQNFGENINIDDTKIENHKKQLYVSNNNDRKLYYKNFKILKNNIELKNNDDGILFKNSIGEYYVEKNNIVSAFNLDKVYQYVSLENNKISVNVPSNVDTQYYWIYSQTINVKEDINYLFILKKITSKTFEAISIQYKNSEGAWVDGSINTNRNDFEFIYLGKTGITEVRIALACQRGDAIETQLPILQEIL